jgi:hypothetical protein
MRRERVGLGPFLEALEQRLDSLSARQLREILVDHATQLPADERAEFLALFDQPSRTEDNVATGSGEAGAATLLADVESFVADIAAGVYVDGRGYDADYRDHRAVGDETWTSSLDRLLDRAGMTLLAGDAGCAREAYRQGQQLRLALRPAARRRPRQLRVTLADQAPQATDRYRATPNDNPLLSTLLTDHLEHHPPSAPERQRWLSTGRRLVDGRIDEVVGGQHRTAYARVAHLAAACAEAIKLTTGPHDASRYLDDLHARYPRHSLFRRELRTIAAQSPLLGMRPAPAGRASVQDRRACSGVLLSPARIAASFSAAGRSHAGIAWV